MANIHSISSSICSYLFELLVKNYLIRIINYINYLHFTLYSEKYEHCINTTNENSANVNKYNNGV